MNAKTVRVTARCDGRMTRRHVRRRGWMIAACAAAMLLATSGDACADDHQTPPASGTAAAEAIQTKCPVLANNPISPDIHTDYRGKRVYFCCEMCKSAFLDAPEKYLDRLPQFAPPAPAAAKEPAVANGQEEPKEAESLAASLAAPTGILTLSLVALAVVLALVRRTKGLNVRTMLMLHKVVGFCALLSGLIHATIIVIAT